MLSLLIGDSGLYGMGICLFEGAQVWVGVCMLYSIDQEKMKHAELMC